MIEYGFSKSHLQKIVETGLIQFREGVKEFLEILNENNIPLVIMSASGVGEAIKLIFERNNFFFDNINIIANSFEWDEQGLAIKPKEPIIHSLNKDETLIKNFSEIFAKIKDRKNVILLGDKLGDVAMVDGFEHDNLLKIGFFNEASIENLESFKKDFDVVILKDGSMDFVNNFLKEVVN